VSLGLFSRSACDFPLEPFTRGLASDGADQHAQRFVAVTARLTLTRCSSKPLIALASRTDHNPATPSPSLMLALELSTSAIPAAAITQLPDAGGAGGAVKPGVPTTRGVRRGVEVRQPVRDEAKRSGLTGPRTAEQLGLVMAALVNDGDAQRENERDERDAQGWETVRR
jgi:hypothetical protein